MRVPFGLLNETMFCPRSTARISAETVVSSATFAPVPAATDRVWRWLIDGFEPGGNIDTAIPS